MTDTPNEDHRAQITRTAWEALSADYRTGTITAADTMMLRGTLDQGTTLIPIHVVDRAELFPLGTLTATPAALKAAAYTPGILNRLIRRHHRGDWGELTADDHHANDAALTEGGTLHSVYRVGLGGPAPTITFWVVTEADRSATTVLLPDDY